MAISTVALLRPLQTPDRSRGEAPRCTTLLRTSSHAFVALRERITSRIGRQGARWVSERSRYAV